MAEHGLKVPRAVLPPARSIVGVTDAVCASHLDAEYARLARRLIERLGRRRPTPIVRGDARIWAAGVLYAVGQVNFLFDRTQTPHLTTGELASAAGVKQTTMANKAGTINRLLDIGMYEPDLTRMAMIEQHPLAWIVEVDGLLVDARMLPEELLQVARNRGPIPDLDALRAAA